MAKASTFQDLILTLQSYWAAQGCLILQPYDNEMGAGTFHPATTLRALGPRPWKAAFVQPSRRPSDGSPRAVRQPVPSGCGIATAAGGRSGAKSEVRASIYLRWRTSRLIATHLQLHLGNC